MKYNIEMSILTDFWNWTVSNLWMVNDSDICGHDDIVSYYEKSEERKGGKIQQCM